jgi:hypothetical protein
MEIQKRVLKSGAVRWRVRWRQGDKYRSQTFDRKGDAMTFAAEVRRRQQLGTLAVQRPCDARGVRPQDLGAGVHGEPGAEDPVSLPASDGLGRDQPQLQWTKLWKNVLEHQLAVVARSDDAEVTAVQGGEFGDLQALGNRDNKRVCGAQWQVGVPLHEVRRTLKVVDRRLRESEEAGLEGA